MYLALRCGALSLDVPRCPQTSINNVSYVQLPETFSFFPKFVIETVLLAASPRLQLLMPFPRSLSQRKTVIIFIWWTQTQLSLTSDIYIKDNCSILEITVCQVPRVSTNFPAAIPYSTQYLRLPQKQFQCDLLSLCCNLSWIYYFILKFL